MTTGRMGSGWGWSNRSRSRVPLILVVKEFQTAEPVEKGDFHILLERSKLLVHLI
jgi:hypothetical protein